jgi:TRAP-type C4-dicarboxylate transport system substrate-binding protein
MSKVKKFFVAKNKGIFKVLSILEYSCTLEAMTALDNFLNSLSEEDRKVLKVNDVAHRSETDIDQEQDVKEAYKRILDLQVASGQISESDRDRILSDFADK